MVADYPAAQPDFAGELGTAGVSFLNAPSLRAALAHLQEEVQAITTALSTMPGGDQGSVKARFIALEARVAAAEAELAGEVAAETPATPAGLALTALSETSLRASWTLVTGADGYLLRYRETGTTPWSSINPTTSPHDITGLVAGTSYDVAVAATNTSGTSAWSSTVVGTTPDVVLTTADTWQTVIDGEAAGTHYLVAAGTHRHQSVVPQAGDTFTGATGGGAIMSGAKVLSSWTAASPNWYASGQTQEGVVIAEDETIAGFERDARPEDLWFNNVRLRHVDSIAALGTGKWFFDYTADRIYVRDNPTAATVETSVTPQAFNGDGVDNVTIKNLTVTRYANPALGVNAAIAGFRSNGWLLENLKVFENHAGGIGTGLAMTIRNCVVTYNGQIGIVGVDTSNDATPEWEDDLIVEGTEIAHNRQLGYNWGWEGGGTKFIVTRGHIFRNNWVHHNKGAGAWWDIDNQDAVIESNLIELNEEAGIFYEINFGATIRWNRCINNGTTIASGDSGSNVWISTSTDCEVYGNWLTGSRHGVLAKNDDRGNSNLGGTTLRETTGLNIHHNDITLTDGEAGLRETTGDATYYTSKGNGAQGNIWRLPTTGASKFYWSGATRNFTSWQSLGLDTTGSVFTQASAGSLPAGAVAFVHTTRGPQ